MDYSKILAELENESLFNIFRLKCALGVLLEDPKKLLLVKRQLRIGMKVSFFHQRYNKLVNGTLEQINRTSTYVIEDETNERWTVSLHCLNINDCNTQFYAHHQKTNLTRCDFQVGDRISFFDKNNKEIFGVITQLNTKTASITARNQSRWRVGYGQLAKIIDMQHNDETVIDIADFLISSS